LLGSRAFVIQLYVVDHLVVDVILGQPFFVLAEAAITYQHAGTISFEVTQPGDPRRWQIPTSPVPSPWDTSEPPGTTYYASRIVAEDSAEEESLRFRVAPRASGVPPDTPYKIASVIPRPANVESRLTVLESVA
jgi:hypothetical protein